MHTTYYGHSFLDILNKQLLETNLQRKLIENNIRKLRDTTLPNLILSYEIINRKREALQILINDEQKETE